MLINCDYLELYLLGTVTPETVPQFTFRLREVGTRIYSKVYDVQYLGVLFGTLQTCPRVHTMSEHACNFKLDNEQLYLAGTNSVLVQFLEQTGLVFQSITRIDIACDFHTFAGGLHPSKLVLDYISGGLERKGRELGNFSVHYAGRAITGCSFGSRTSERFGRMYNKSLLLKTENKPHISAFHEMNGLTSDISDIWRLEFTLRGKEVKRLFKPRELTRAGREKMSIGVKAALGSAEHLLTHDVMKGIFIAELNSYFTFLPPGKDTNRTRRKSLLLLDFSSDLEAPALILRIAVKRSAAAKNYRYRTAVKTLLLDYYLTKNEEYLIVAMQFVQKYNLHNLVSSRFAYWYKEFMPYIDDSYKYVSIIDMLPTLERAV